jgi:hypothetical protein
MIAHAIWAILLATAATFAGRRAQHYRALLDDRDGPILATPSLLVLRGATGKFRDLRWVFA